MNCLGIATKPPRFSATRTEPIPPKSVPPRSTTLEGNKWLDIDNTLISTADGSVQNKANQFKVKFPQKPKEKDFTRLFDYTIAGQSIMFGLKNTPDNRAKAHANPADTVAQVQKNKVKYPELYPSVTFDYVVDGSKVKENIVLNSYQGKNGFEFMIQASGLKAEKQTDGSIKFRDKASGGFLFNIPRPYMFNSNKEAGPEGTVSEEVTQEITPVSGGYLLTLSADEGFLTDPATVYPVTIDPWVDAFNAQDTYIASATPYNYYNSQSLYVGHDATIGRTRSLIKWPLPQIPNTEVTKAEIGLYQYDAYTQAAPVNVGVQQPLELLGCLGLRLDLQRPKKVNPEQ